MLVLVIKQKQNYKYGLEIFYKPLFAFFSK